MKHKTWTVEIQEFCAKNKVNSRGPNLPQLRDVVVVDDLKSLLKQLDFDINDKDKEIFESIAGLTEEEQLRLLETLQHVTAVSGEDFTTLLEQLGVGKDMLSRIKKLEEDEQTKLTRSIALLAYQDQLPANVRRALYKRFAESFGDFFDWTESSDPGWSRIWP